MQIVLACFSTEGAEEIIAAINNNSRYEAHMALDNESVIIEDSAPLDPQDRL